MGWVVVALGCAALAAWLARRHRARRRRWHALRVNLDALDAHAAQERKREEEAGGL